MTYKAPSREALQAECDAFNFDYPVGSRVAVKIDGTDKPLITTTRTVARVLSGHSAVVWLDGVTGCYDLGHITPCFDLAHVTPIPPEPVEGEAWAVLAASGNVIYWSRDRDQVADVARQHHRPYGPYTPRAPRAAATWTTTPPTEQGEYWHWNGDPDSAPTVFSILYSGTAKKCFVPMNQSYTGQAIMCDVYGGHWLRIQPPQLPKTPE